MKLAKDNLPVFKIPKDINKEHWVTNRGLAELLHISDYHATEVMSVKKFHYPHAVRRLYGRDYLNVNEITYKKQYFNATREYYFIQMFDALYFELSRYLSDLQIGTLFSALDERHTPNSWAVYLSTYIILFNERALLFMQLAKKVLCTKALVRNFKPRWDL